MPIIIYNKHNMKCINLYYYYLKTNYQNLKINQLLFKCIKWVFVFFLIYCVCNTSHDFRQLPTRKLHKLSPNLYPLYQTLFEIYVLYWRRFKATRTIFNNS